MPTIVIILACIGVGAFFVLILNSIFSSGKGSERKEELKTQNIALLIIGICFTAIYLLVKK